MVGPYVGHRPRSRSRRMAAQGGPQGVARRATRGAGHRDRDPPDLARDRVRGRPARPTHREDHRAGAADRGAKWRPAVTSLEQVDPDIAKALRAEAERQNRNLELIASEN